MCIRDSDYAVELGGGRLLPEFDQRLLGMGAGETVTFPVGLSLIHISEPTRPY